MAICIQLNTKLAVRDKSFALFQVSWGLESLVVHCRIKVGPREAMVD